MRQEVEIKVTGDFDASLDKKQIKYEVQQVLNQSPYRRDLVLNVKSVKEEAEIYETNQPEFINGFPSWNETYFEVVSVITHIWRLDKPYGLVAERHEAQGTGGLYELAEELTKEFEKKNEGRQWDGEFFEEIEEFLNNKLCQENQTNSQ